VRHGGKRAKRGGRGEAEFGGAEEGRVVAPVVARSGGRCRFAQRVGAYVQHKGWRAFALAGIEARFTGQMICGRPFLSLQNECQVVTEFRDRHTRHRRLKNEILAKAKTGLHVAPRKPSG